MYLHLMNVGQKVELTKLLNMKLGDEDLLNKVSQIMNCKPEFVWEFIKGVQQSMKDMETFLIQRAKMKHL